MKEIIKDESTGISIRKGDIIMNVELCDENASVPEYANSFERDGVKIPMDFGLDIKAVSVEYDEKMDCYIYHTGLKFNMPEDVVMLLFPRSSNRKTDAYLANSVGVIDWSFNKEVLVCFKNRTSLEDRKMRIEHDIIKNSILNKEGLTEIRKRLEQMEEINPMDYAPYEVGNKIAQIAVLRYNATIMNQVDFVKDGGRGCFGSTGN